MASRAEVDQGQPGTRRNWIGYDQHGRKWHGTAEKNSGYPAGVIQPMGWDAPFLPPQGTDTFKFNKEDPSRFTINYEFLLDERLKAVKELDDDRQQKAVDRGWDPDDPEKQEPLDRLCGKRDAINRPEVIAACMQGDKWTLGLTDKVNPKVQPYLPKKPDRRSVLLSKMPDFTVQDEDELEDRLDIEEQHDREALGGKMEKLPRRKKAKAEVSA